MLSRGFEVAHTAEADNAQWARIEPEWSQVVQERRNWKVMGICDVNYKGKSFYFVHADGNKKMLLYK